ncbi:hypothetical protein DFH01_21515 [Falsiroseomonas bella]|uniref:Class I SAM-dependent methyltransferase n=1 Tax=Falsiroseomonas bella TaxID=2184016 RepID=A0A317FA70_9PROT|nr:class I SAM-dependent methyltransferase [Falsiroseomonas bella]PWS34927.1 hypothetical protein DFH01_21515 [Falsiroseomonas bella]
MSRPPPPALPALHPRLQRYLDGPWGKVQGFVHPDAMVLLDVALAFQESHGITGGFFEIGVHQGRFLLALEHAAGTGEPGLALDVFEDQALNIDKSGHGQRAVLEANLAAHALEPGRVAILQGDSTAPATRRAVLARGESYRFISVDGGHTAGHAASDLRLAEEVATPGAAVVLDDFFNTGFPGVTEGLAQYLTSGGTLRPVGVIGGKMLLSPLSWSDRMRAALRKRFAESPRFRVREVSFFGFPYTQARVA